MGAVQGVRLAHGPSAPISSAPRDAGRQHHCVWSACRGGTVFRTGRSLALGLTTRTPNLGEAGVRSGSPVRSSWRRTHIPAPRPDERTGRLDHQFPSRARGGAFPPPLPLANPPDDRRRARLGPVDGACAQRRAHSRPARTPAPSRRPAAVTRRILSDLPPALISEHQTTRTRSALDLHPLDGAQVIGEHVVAGGPSTSLTLAQPAALYFLFIHRLAADASGR